ncbi:uncharacterized protein LOC113504417 isoform X4 [Trichoplusia ni]|uniref:Uncharacterized protein LOC113504417 isoform X4 n=1 Tax=Trichoplusia ni TaxID=7111 RepID=A0A7E5WP03_TRINI|nr:uncharacterized protein LOC113504417 isoform X4 [Trichoplusia ni]
MVYGVTEGGVTRRIARAMEVLHASGPGARVRVMRAAYHSSAAPGTPAASFMLQSSRRVISSGFDFLEPPSAPIKPLEISSTPYESSPEPNTEAENYKVTEPDDFDISEPSKWRGSTRGSSIRMPSEESSSTDNASIIDLDARLGKNLLRKYSYDSECSEIQFGSRNTSRNSPLLDTPVTLSTLKYKSLLNNSNDWNSRRKSYSFEDTAPLNESIIHSNDTLAMESSTDSGICKSTEIVNDYMDDSTHTKSFPRDDKKPQKNEESFRDWLSKNRPISQYRGTKFKTYRDHEIVMEDPIENNITLQSSGKVSITLPVTVEGDDENYQKVSQVIEDGERKVKRVEFCKTEVHFTAESGKVNIIETDNKPPPSNDFRKRRSAFVPMQDMIEKPITLFGDKTDIPTTNGIGTALNVSGSELSESDENTAATKSILKNKIPKPKPYLLGENMAFGMPDDLLKKDLYSESKLTAVSLVNKQLEPEKHQNEVKPMFPRDAGVVIKPKPLRTINTGPTKTDSLKSDKTVTIHTVQTEEATTVNDVKTRFSGLQLSPVPRKPKTRQLRESDLTYFGVDNNPKSIHTDHNPVESKMGRTENVVENIFHSVKLIQQVSNSVCNSEPESEEAPEYQNIPLNINYAPVPTPRQRSRHDDKPKEISEIKVYKPVVEKDYQDSTHGERSLSRRARIRTQHESATSRSISAPPKALRHNPTELSQRREDHSIRSSKNELLKEENRMFSNKKRNSTDDSNPIYVNLSIVAEKPKSYENRDPGKIKTTSSKRENKPSRIDKIKSKLERSGDVPTKEFCYIDKRKEHRFDSETDSSIRKRHSPSKDTHTRQAHKDSLSRRAVQGDKQINAEPNSSRHGRKSREEQSSKEINNSRKSDYRSKSLQRPGSTKVSEDTSKDTSLKRTEQFKDSLEHNQETSRSRKSNSSKDKTHSTKEIIIPSPKLDISSSARHSSSLSKKDDKEQHKTHKLNKRREYVINYDDKNGTVSSICKVTPPSLGTPKRKKPPKEILKDNYYNENSLKNRSINKTAPLQLEDHQMERNGLNYADRKWKTKVHIQRSCQLL